MRVRVSRRKVLFVLVPAETSCLVYGGSAPTLLAIGMNSIFSEALPGSLLEFQ